MRKADIACALVMLAIAVIVMVDSIRIDIGWGMDGPQAGFFPFLMGLGLAIFTVVIVVRAARGKGVAKSTTPFMTRQAVRPVLLVILPAVAMVFLTHFIGLYIASALYLAFSMRVIGKHGWLVIAPISILLPVGFYYMFDKVFLIPMPQGSLPALLGF